MTDVDQTNCHRFLRDRAEYALRSRSRELMYEVNGMAKMARALGAITVEEYMDINHRVVAEGINNRKAYDD